jgi:hypothetical protein
MMQISSYTDIVSLYSILKLGKVSDAVRLCHLPWAGKQHSHWLNEVGRESWTLLHDLTYILPAASRDAAGLAWGNPSYYYYPPAKLELMGGRGGDCRNLNLKVMVIGG